MRHLLTAALLLCWAASALAEDVPIYAVQRTMGRWERVYVLSEARADELAKFDSYEKVGILGFGSSAGGEGLTKLHCAYRDGWHVYYTELPRGQQFPAGTKLEEFPVWVWEKPGDGRIPIYGLSNQDWRNMRYYTDKSKVAEHIEAARKAKGVTLKNHGIVFYLKPAAPADTE